MDGTEADKLRNIRELLEQKDYQGAVELADTMDLRKVSSTNTLLNIVEACEQVRQYHKARELLLELHFRSKTPRRTVLYRLVLDCVRVESYEEAGEFYEQFKNFWPDSLECCELGYELAEASGGALEDRIELLEQYREKKLTEKWGCRLAQLYDQAERADDCRELCHDLIMFFGSGEMSSYVETAVQLKQKYGGLTDGEKAVCESTVERKSTAETERTQESVRESGQESAVEEAVQGEQADPSEEVRFEIPEEEREALRKAQEEYVLHWKENPKTALRNTSLGDQGMSKGIMDVINEKIDGLLGPEAEEESSWWPEESSGESGEPSGSGTEKARCEEEVLGKVREKLAIQLEEAARIYGEETETAREAHQPFAQENPEPQAEPEADAAEEEEAELPVSQEGDSGESEAVAVEEFETMVSSYAAAQNAVVDPTGLVAVRAAALRCQLAGNPLTQSLARQLADHAVAQAGRKTLLSVLTFWKKTKDEQGRLLLRENHFKL